MNRFRAILAGALTVALMAWMAMVGPVACHQSPPVEPDPPLTRPADRDLLLIGPLWPTRDPDLSGLRVTGDEVRIDDTWRVPAELRDRIDIAQIREQAHHAYTRGDAVTVAMLLRTADYRVPLGLDELILLGRAELQLNGLRSADEHLLRARTLAPNDPTATFWLAVARYRQGAVVDFGRVNHFRTGPVDRMPIDHFQQGPSTVTLGARSLFTLAAEQLANAEQPVWSPVWFNLGLCYAETYKWDKAARAFERFLLADDIDAQHRALANRWHAYAADRADNYITPESIVLERRQTNQ